VWSLPAARLCARDNAACKRAVNFSNVMGFLSQSVLLMHVFLDRCVIVIFKQKLHKKTGHGGLS
jgi:hypothetical protein